MTATLLYCLGATKAGTSWLYRYLGDHPEVAVKAVKELHYFDTFDDDTRAKQIDAYRIALDRFRETRAEAEKLRRGWQVENMDRRIADMGGLLRVLEGPRDGDAAYRDYLLNGTDARVIADITPAYALASRETLARMARVLERTRFLFLMRDPLDRLWSHVRMQAVRFAQPGDDVALRAERILNRVTKRGLETHIPARGDYAATWARLSEAVPETDRMAVFAEEMFAGPGREAICAWLGIDAVEMAARNKVHEGEKIAFPEAKRAQALAFLEPQYAWAEAVFGRLPPRWSANRASG